MADRIDQDIFKPIPMAVWQGYTKLGVIYPKGEVYNGEVLTEDFCVAAKPKYEKKLLKHYKNRGH
jgi:hypothetical protein